MHDMQIVLSNCLNVIIFPNTQAGPLFLCVTFAKRILQYS